MGIIIPGSGNSFSNDAARYLHQTARADGSDLTAVNLMIGGCSFLSGSDTDKNKFCDSDGPISDEEIVIIKECMKEISSF